MEGKKMNLSGLMKKFDNYMAAAAFAEEGEFGTASEIAGTRQKVLLVLPGCASDIKCFSYAMNFCKRMRAGLEILCLESGRDIVGRFSDDLRREGIEYGVKVIDGCLKQAVVDITRQNPGIDYVVVNSYRGLETGCGEAMGLPDVREMVRCPLVVVGA